MRHWLTVIGSALVLAAHVSAAASRGHLVLIGGGPTPSDVFTRTLRLAGGRNAIVAVLPQTFPTDSIGDTAVELWKSFGARDVVKVSRIDPEAADAAIKRATLIWMPGGFQGLLMKTLSGTTLPDRIRERYEAGAVIGGASAGAAAMSEVMIADETTPDGAAADGPPTMAGLGLWPEAIVSPHYTERRRQNALSTILRSHPTLVGVGIDEGAGIIVSGGQCEVVGRNTVVIVELAPTAVPGSAAAAMRVRTMKSGAHFTLKQPVK